MWRSLAPWIIFSLIPFLWLRYLFMPFSSIWFISLPGFLWIYLHHLCIIGSLGKICRELTLSRAPNACRHTSPTPSLILLILLSLRLLVIVLPSSKLCLILVMLHPLMWVWHRCLPLAPSMHLASSTSARQLLHASLLLSLLLLMMLSTTSPSRIATSASATVIASMLHQLIAPSHWASRIHRTWRNASGPTSCCCGCLAEGTANIATTKGP